MLQKFDPDIKDGDFSGQPKFASVKADILLKELVDFQTMIAVLDPQDDWNTALKALKACNNGSDLVLPDQWSNLLTNLRELQQSKVLEMIVRLILKNPVWEGKPVFPAEQMTSYWLEEKQEETRKIITGIAEGQRSAQMAALAKAVFAETDTLRLKHYIPERSKVLTSKDLEGYIYAEGLNYLLTFIQDYLEKEIHELCDILLVRGQWSDNGASRQMSDGYHNAVEITDAITALDETLSEEGSNGPRLRAAILRVERDRAQERYINSIVSTLNEEALDLINRSVQALIIVGKHLKMLLDDSQKKHSELIIIWKELGLVSKTPVSPRLGDAYKKINYFVQLMLLETHPVE
jgi:hypothetical protein